MSEPPAQGEGPLGPANESARPANPSQTTTEGTPTERPRYYWEQRPLSGVFDLEAVQATLRTMTDEEVARAVLAIRMPARGTLNAEGVREKSPAQREREKGKRQSQKELLRAAREFLAMQAAALPQEAPPDDEQ